MTFENMRLDRITAIVYYKPTAASAMLVKNRTDHILGINISGIADHDLGYKQMHLESGYIYFFNRRDDYFEDDKEPGYCYSIHFTTTEPIDTDSFCKKVNNSEEIVRMIQQVERARLNSAGSELLVLSEFYRVCDKFKQLVDQPYSKRDLRMADAKTYIDLHFKEKDCVETAVADSGITRRRFGDLFRQQFGLPPGEYVLRKKIGYAQELLSVTNLTIADTAELAGFCDIYYFSRMFKKMTGITPGEYKKQKTTCLPIRACDKRPVNTSQEQ